MFKYIFMVFLVMCSLESHAKIGVEEGSLKLIDFLDACPEIGNFKPSSKVRPSISGKIISIKGILYEIRFFSFEDTSGKLSPEISFRSYARQNNLLSMKSFIVSVLPGIQFETFDFRRSPVKDGVYFSMAIRKLEDEKKLGE